MQDITLQYNISSYPPCSCSFSCSPSSRKHSTIWVEIGPDRWGIHDGSTTWRGLGLGTGVMLPAILGWSQVGERCSVRPPAVKTLRPRFCAGACGQYHFGGTWKPTQHLEFCAIVIEWNERNMRIFAHLAIPSRWRSQYSSRNRRQPKLPVSVDQSIDAHDDLQPAKTNGLA